MVDRVGWTSSGAGCLGLFLELSDGSRNQHLRMTRPAADRLPKKDPAIRSGAKVFWEEPPPRRDRSGNRRSGVRALREERGLSIGLKCSSAWADCRSGIGPRDLPWGWRGRAGAYVWRSPTTTDRHSGAGKIEAQHLNVWAAAYFRRLFLIGMVGRPQLWRASISTQDFGLDLLGGAIFLTGAGIPGGGVAALDGEHGPDLRP